MKLRVALIAVTALVVICAIAFWLKADADGLAAGPARPGGASVPRAAISPVEAEQPEAVPAQASAPHGPEVPAELLREVEQEFARLLPSIRAQTLALEAERQALIRQHPIIVQGPEYARQLQDHVAEEYAEVASRVDELRESKSRELGIVDASLPSLLLPQLVVRTLSSNDKVGNSTLAAITSDILRDTNYLEILRAGMNQTLARYLPDAQIAPVADVGPAQANQYLDAMVAQFAEAQAKVMPPSLLDDRASEYLVEKNYADQVWCMMQFYARSWTADLKQSEEQRDADGRVLRKVLERLPPESSEYRLLEMDLICAVRYGK